MIMMVAPLPFLSYMPPKSGVMIRFPNGMRLGIRPASVVLTPYLFSISDAAYFMNGNTAE